MAALSHSVLPRTVDDHERNVLAFRRLYEVTGEVFYLDLVRAALEALQEAQEEEDWLLGRILQEWAQDRSWWPPEGCERIS